MKGGRENTDYMTLRIYSECIKKKKTLCQTGNNENALFQIKNGKKSHHNYRKGNIVKNHYTYTYIFGMTEKENQPVLYTS